MDPLLKALCYYDTCQPDQAVEECSRILERKPQDQASWTLKLRCLGEKSYLDELENEETGVADAFLDDAVLVTNARPGTSFARPLTSAKTPSPAIRPRSTAGRPLSGVQRPAGTARLGTMEQTLRTSRTSTSARPVSASSGRLLRLGTASMISQTDGPFINLARLNVEKYAADVLVNKALFEYVFYQENDIRLAHQIAAVATRSAEFGDWYWKNQLGKCYYRLGMFRDAEKQFLSSLNNWKTGETFALLAKVYVRLDQPSLAMEQYKAGLEHFKNDITLLTGLARVQERLGDLEMSIETYKRILREDASNVEAIACIGTNLFYCDQPEIALRYYRRILQMGVNKAELFLNVGLCCFYCQQLDLAIVCIERALRMADQDVVADIWYNTGHIALACGDTVMATRCFRLATAADSDGHAESLTNLGTLQMRQGKLDQARSSFSAAIVKGPHLFEPLFNLALLAYQTGQYEEAHQLVLKALVLYPDHADSKNLQTHLDQLFKAL